MSKLRCAASCCELVSLSIVSVVRPCPNVASQPQVRATVTLPFGPRPGAAEREADYRRLDDFLKKFRRLDDFLRNGRKLDLAPQT